MEKVNSLVRKFYLTITTLTIYDLCGVFDTLDCISIYIYLQQMYKRWSVKTICLELLHVLFLLEYLLLIHYTLHFETGWGWLPPYIGARNGRRRNPTLGTASTVQPNY
jgi:hypothetical protein